MGLSFADACDMLAELTANAGYGRNEIGYNENIRKVEKSTERKKMSRTTPYMCC
jgi:hypothetical protein